MHQIKLFDTNRANEDFFGVSVSINGDYAIVGSLFDDENGFLNNGSASIYKRNATNGIWALQVKLLNPNPANDDNFGCSVSISGDYAVVGTYQDDEAGGTDNGSVTMYKRIGNSWTKIIKNTNPLTNNNENFGSSVAIDGSNKRFLVGAPGAQANAGMAFFGKAAF